MSKCKIFAAMLFFCMVFLISGCSNSQALSSETAEESKSVAEDSKIQQIVDVKQFALISPEELIDIMGEPSESEEWTYDNKLVETYRYDDMYHYDFTFGTMANGEKLLVTFKIYSETYNDANGQDFSYHDITDIPLMFGIEDARKNKDTGSAVRFDFGGTNYYDLWVQIMNQSSNTFSEVKFTFVEGF